MDLAAPVLQFQFLYQYPFATIAQAFLQKYNYEKSTHLTTVSGVT